MHQFVRRQLFHELTDKTWRNVTLRLRYRQ
jgi:hypothetical protein